MHAPHRIGQFPRSTLAKINKVELRAVAAPDDDRSSAEARWAEAATLDPSGNAGQRSSRAIRTASCRGRPSARRSRTASANPSG